MNIKKIAGLVVFVAVLCCCNPAQAERPRRAKIGITVFTLLGVGALGSAAGILAFDQHSLKKLATEDPAMYQMDAYGVHVREALKEYDTRYLAAMCLIGAGGVLGIAAILWAAFDKEDDSNYSASRATPRRFAIAPVIGREQIGVNAAFRF